MKAYELLVFDWDGTLVDSAGEIVARMQQAIQGVGLPERTPEQMRELIGLGFNDVLARLFPDLDPRWVRERLHRYRARYGMQRSRATLFEPVRVTLDILQRQGYVMAVATGRGRRALNESLADTGTAGRFRLTRCADESVPKPAPDMLEDILLRTGVARARMLMIGDTEYDVVMANAAGVDSVGVASGVHDGARLRQAGAVTVLDSVEDLPGWLTARRHGLASES